MKVEANVKKLLELLAKLGILRFGGKAATYKGGERPSEFAMDDVLDAKRDLVNGADANDNAKDSGK